MKVLKTVFIWAWCFVLSSCALGGSAKEKVIASYSLSPGEEREVTVSATHPAMVGWELVGDIRKGHDCPEHRCATLYSMDQGSQITGWYGGGMLFTPRDGKIRLKLRNLAPFPIDVNVFRK